MKKAFTLAEVLITMTIIAVIAVLTVPNLMGDTKSKSLKSKFRTTYTALQQGFELAVNDNNAVVKWTADNLEENIMKYFKAKSITVGSGESIRTIIGNTSYPTKTGKADEVMQKYRLGNGALLIFPRQTTNIMTSTGCTKQDQDDISSMCIVFLDINGKSAPNETLMCTSGTTRTTLSEACLVDENKISDIFPLVLTDKTIKPLTNAVQVILDE